MWLHVALQEHPMDAGEHGRSRGGDEIRSNQRACAKGLTKQGYGLLVLHVWRTNLNAQRCAKLTSINILDK